jgi:hypothetical protein
MLNEVAGWKRSYVCLSGTGYGPFSSQPLQIYVQKYVIIAHIPTVMKHNSTVDTYGSIDNELGKRVGCGCMLLCHGFIIWSFFHGYEVAQILDI